MFNSFGNIFRLTSFGESHGKGVGGVIDGFPAGIVIDEEFVQQELNRRRPGQSILTTARKEADKVEFLSGIFEGKSTGCPIGFIVWNENQHSNDYNNLKNVYRPSHADYTYTVKYGIRDHRGGGRSSARETISRVQGGLSNGQDIYFRVVFKPIATLLMEQETVNIDGIDTTLKARGRHDACVLPRAVPIVEAMAAMTILDYYLLDKTTQL